MSRSFAATLLALLLLASTSPSAMAQTGQSLRVTAERTNLRDRASSEAAAVVSVSRGEVLQIVEVTGAWFRVRTAAGREGFIHSLLVERIAALPQTTGAAPASPPSVAPTPTTAVPPPGSPSGARPVSGLSAGGGPYGNRRFGVGAANNGASLRYWMSERAGLQADGVFGHSYGYRGTVISPSLLVHFKEPRSLTVLTLLPYLGGGATFTRYDKGYRAYYCQRFTDCTNRTMAFGGFVGTEAVIRGVPALGLSGTFAYYSESLGYGGIMVGVGAHYYFGAR